jgi:hypothetical protein
MNPTACGRAGQRSDRCALAAARDGSKQRADHAEGLQSQDQTKPWCSEEHSFSKCSRRNSVHVTSTQV